MIICIDFDGTVLTDSFPYYGKDIGAIPVLKALVKNGHKIILYTIRSHREVKYSRGSNLPKPMDTLSLAIEWFEKNGIDLYGVNTYPDQKDWTYSPKAFAHYYIDDRNIGCPLINTLDSRPFVNWKLITNMLLEKNLITKKDSDQCRDYWSKMIDTYINHYKVDEYCSFYKELSKHLL